MTRAVDALVASAIQALSARLEETRAGVHVYKCQARWSALLLEAAALLPGIGPDRWEAEVAPTIEALASTWDDEQRVVPTIWHSPALLAAHAQLITLCRTLVIRDQGPLAPLLTSPHLGTIHTLSLSSIPLAGDPLDALLGHELTGLTTLLMNSCGLGDAEIARMTAHEALWRGLRHVELMHNKLRDASGQALADCPYLSGLETLKLGYNPLGKEGRIALGLSPHLSQRAKSSARAVATPPAVAPVSAADTRDVFGDVRSVLQQAPSAHGWALLCDRVERMDPERAQQEAIPYALRGLDGWPAALRVLPNVWAESIISGVVPTGASLARAITLHSKTLDISRASAIASWAAQVPIERLTLRSGSASHKALMALLNNTSWPALRALTCDCDLPTTTFTALKIGGQHLAIEELDLRTIPAKGESASAAEVAALIHAPLIRGLRGLRLRSYAQHPEGLHALREAPWWWRLELLELRSRSLSSVAQGALLGGSGDPRWEQLHTLMLSDLPAREADPAGFDELAQRMPALRMLGLHASPGEPLWRTLNAPWIALDTVVLERIPSDDPASIKGFTGWELPTLRHLDLQFTSFGDIRTSHGAPHAILSSPAASALETLVLRGGYMDDARLPIVCAHLPATLTALTLDRSSVGPEGARSLATRQLPALRTLRLQSADIPRKAMAALHEASWWPQLEHLALTVGRAEDMLASMAGRLPPGLKTLVLHAALRDEEQLIDLLKGGLPATLESLTLSQCSMSSEGLKALCHLLPSLPRLHTLDLRDNAISHKAIAPLLDSPQLTQLAILELSGNRLGFAGKELVMTSHDVPLYAKDAL
jgi:hypothetical protein